MLAVVVSALGSCSKKDSAARRGGTLIVGEISNFQSLNPMGTTDAHARDIYKLLFLTLMDEQADFITFKPRLAESYEFSDDRKRLTFHIRRDVVWSDGLPVTAHDVAATFRAQKNPDVAWSGRHLKEHIDSVEVIDEWTVTYHFNRVYLYQLMDANDGPILPKHALDKVPPEKIRQIPAEELPTNGPFRIEEWVKGQALTLVPYSGYYEEGKPYLDKVIYKIIPDRVTLMTQLRSGEIDCMESIPLGEVDNLRKSNPELRILDYPSRNYTYIAWNGAHPFFGNPRVRRALTMAIDRKLIIDNIYYGYAEECTSPFVPLIWAYNPDIEPIPYDPERAAEILAEEEFSDTDSDGWLDRDGRRFEFEIMTNYGNQIRSDIQVMVQEMLRKIGIKVNPVILEWTVFMDHLTSSNFEATVSALRIGTKADLSPIWSCESRRKGGYNRVDYCNRVVDSLNAEASSMLDLDKARPLFFKAQEIIYNEQPFTFICRPRPLGALNRRFKDAKPDAIGMYHNLQDWWVLRDE
jgi:peptide/nickel transport system substrate-binding protein